MKFKTDEEFPKVRSILEEFVEFSDEGILENFGRIAGTYDFERGVVSLSNLSKTLGSLLPVYNTGHMLCCLVCKNHQGEKKTAQR